MGDLNYSREIKKLCTLREIVIKHSDLQQRKNVFKKQLLRITAIFYELIFH